MGRELSPGWIFRPKGVYYRYSESYRIDTWNLPPHPQLRCLCGCYVRPARATVQDETQGLLLMLTILGSKKKGARRLHTGILSQSANTKATQE